MTFLEICLDLASKAGIPNSDLADVSTASNELGRVISWAREANRDLQTFRNGDWKFLHQEYQRDTRAMKLLDAAPAVDAGAGSVTIPITGHGFFANDYLTINGTSNYDGTYLLTAVTANDVTFTTTYVAETFSGLEQTSVRDYEFLTASSVDHFDLDSFKFYLKADGANYAYDLTYVEYKDFKRKFADYSQTDEPSFFTVTPDKKIRLYPQIDGVYTITAEAFSEPQTLAANADVPVMPSKFHMIIVWKALIDYGGYEETSQVMTHASLRYQELWDQLVWQELYEKEERVVRVC